MELISVIMTVYNETENWLELSINSILNQTYRNIEFVIIIDTVDKKTIQIVEKLCNNDERCIIVKNERNIGLVQSLNKAIQYSNGEYIARMDADDIARLNRLEIQHKLLVQKNVDFIFSNVDLIDENNRLVRVGNKIERNSSTVSKILPVGNISKHPTWFLKKNVYVKNKGYREVSYAEDYDFILRALLQKAKIYQMEEVTLYYRYRKSSISRMNSLIQYKNSRFLRKAYKNGYIKDNDRVYSCLNIIEKETTKCEKIKYIEALVYYNNAIAHIKDKKIYKGISCYLKAFFKSKYIFINTYDFFKFKIYSFCIRK
ncbi:glycosyltransferase [Vagococcus lutrae]|uniref:glycosyltransferase family 2 protein n=1 Tax=Vagococcus lutrae TaxID=81947 RepID=UPI00289233A3|nr:glycosyltransferase [Vagococcus lutrae]MDT2802005.1 glycosyltransferase [Vagococcus lutrae]